MGIKGIPRIKREKAPLDGLAKLEQQADIVVCPHVYFGHGDRMLILEIILRS
jgi:hypothetical protein